MASTLAERREREKEKEKELAKDEAKKEGADTEPLTSDSNDNEGEDGQARGSAPLTRKRSFSAVLIAPPSLPPVDSLSNTPVSVSPLLFDPNAFDPSAAIFVQHSSSKQMTPRGTQSNSKVVTGEELPTEFPESRPHVRFSSLAAVVSQRAKTASPHLISPGNSLTSLTRGAVLKKAESKELLPIINQRRQAASTPPSRSPPTVDEGKPQYDSDDDEGVDMSRIFHNLVTPRPNRKTKRLKEDASSSSSSSKPAISFDPSEDEEWEQEEYILTESFRELLLASGLHPSFVEKAIKYFDKDGDQKISCDELVRIEGMGYGSDIVERALMQLLIIPDFDAFGRFLDDIYLHAKESKGGDNASYIPELRDVDRSIFGASICTIHTQSWLKGDTNRLVTAQAISWAVTYCATRELIGAKQLSRFVGQEPSGNKSNAFVFDKFNRPHNPFTNVGAIVTASLFHPYLAPPSRFKEIMKIWADLVGSDVRFDNTTYLSEIEHADRNYSLAYMAKDAGVFDEKYVATHGDITRELQFYFQCCSIFVTVEQLSVLAATLANCGVNPLTGKKVFSPDTVKDCLSLLYSTGMEDYSGQFAFNVGLPAKSSASGLVILVVPGVMGVSLWSPPLDNYGNSVRGLEFAQKFAATFPFHAFEEIGGDHLTRKVNPLKPLSKDDTAEAARVCYELIFAAANGDLAKLIQLLNNNSDADVNSADYDGRTPLHLAVAEQRKVVVDYLLRNGASVSAKDRWGTTPMDEAIKAKNAEILHMLKNPPVQTISRRRSSTSSAPSSSSKPQEAGKKDAVDTEKLLALLAMGEKEGVSVAELLERTLSSLNGGENHH